MIPIDWPKHMNVWSADEQGAGRAFSAGGDLKMFYEGKSGMNMI